MKNLTRKNSTTVRYIDLFAGIGGFRYAMKDDYFDTTELEPVSFPKLKPSTKTISIRLPEMLLDSIKILANKRDVPYQSLIKTYLQEKIDREFHTKPA